MPFDLITIPCLSDNYAYLLRDGDSGEVAVIDVPEAGPILAELATRGWTPSQVWLTHHHWDHVDGLADLLAAYPAQVVGASADAPHRWSHCVLCAGGQGGVYRRQPDGAGVWAVV